MGRRNESDFYAAKDSISAALNCYHTTRTTLLREVRKNNAHESKKFVANLFEPQIFARKRWCLFAQECDAARSTRQMEIWAMQLTHRKPIRLICLQTYIHSHTLVHQGRRYEKQTKYCTHKHTFYCCVFPLNRQYKPNVQITESSLIVSLFELVCTPSRGWHRSMFIRHPHSYQQFAVWTTPASAGKHSFQK